jgi:hypothetical protein
MIRALRAFPPNAPARKGCHVPRSQVAVPLRMPERCRLGKAVSQRMSCRNPMAGAKRAASAVRGATLDVGPPRMARVLPTPPPDAPAGSGPDIPRRERAVSFAVPLAGDGRLQGSQGIAAANRSPAAEWAAAATKSSDMDGRLPPVVRRLGTSPPNAVLRSGADISGRELAVPFRVPLPRRRRHSGSQGLCAVRTIVLAERTAPCARPKRTCLPFMSSRDRASPPDRTPRVDRHIGWTKRGVPLVIELACQAREIGENRHDVSWSSGPGVASRRRRRRSRVRR